MCHCGPPMEPDAGCSNLAESCVASSAPPDPNFRRRMVSPAATARCWSCSTCACCAPRPRAPTWRPGASAPATARGASWRPPWSGAKLARRSGDADRAAQGRRRRRARRRRYAAGHRQQGWARARLEQASCAHAGRRALRRRRARSGGRDRGERSPARRRRGGHAGALDARPDPRPPQRSPPAARPRRGPPRGSSTIRSRMLESAGRREAHLKLAGGEARLVRADLLDRRRPAPEGRGPDPRRRSATSPPPRSGWMRPTSR